MARARNIKPGFFTNDELVELPFEVRLLFIGLWTLADREGRLVDRPKKIKMEIFPADSVECDGALAMLEKSGFILRYTKEDGKFIQIINWKKHQNPHIKEAASSIPSPWENDADTNQTNNISDEHHASTIQAPCNTQPLPARAGLIPDSGYLIPDSLNPIPEPTPLLQTTLINQDAPEDEPKKPRAEIALSIAFRANGVRCQPADPRLLQLAAQGVTPETVAAACMEAKESSPDSLNLGYVIKIIERWAKKAAEVQAKGAAAPKRETAWWATDVTIIAKGTELSMMPNPGEGMPSFKARIQAAIDNGGVPPAARPGPAMSISVADEERKAPVRRPAGAPSLASMVKNREAA